MQRGCLLLVLLGWSMAVPAVARAAPHGDGLAQCLIQATTPADRKVVVRWAFATMALDPDVAPMANVTPAERDALNRRTGALVTDLLASSCGQQVQQTLLREGPQGIAGAFEAWGRWAVTGLVAQPQVAAGLTGLLRYIDIGRLMSLMPLQGPSP